MRRRDGVSRRSRWRLPSRGGRSEVRRPSVARQVCTARCAPRCERHTTQAFALNPVDRVPAPPFSKCSATTAACAPAASARLRTCRTAGTVPGRHRGSAERRSPLSRGAGLAEMEAGGRRMAELSISWHRRGQAYRAAAAAGVRTSSSSAGESPANLLTATTQRTPTNAKHHSTSSQHRPAAELVRPFETRAHRSAQL